MKVNPEDTTDSKMFKKRYLRAKSTLMASQARGNGKYDAVHKVW